ncbi:MAG: PPOX class F420-dependent oxidoreductase [Chloroflexi bacterium]|nr:MAG: PPOX class F420-dependent oxidoreductase [Chloroflexota bacterium]
MPATATLSPVVQKLITGSNFGHLTTLMRDGSPQVTIVWVDLDGDRILINTAEGRQKPRNLRRDPRVALSIADQENPYASASIRGRVVEMTHEGADEHIDKLAKKYLGQDRYPFRQPGEQRLILVVQPEHVATNIRE